MRVLSHTSAKRMARCSLVSLMPKSYVITCGASVRKLLAALLFLIAGAAAAQWPARPVKLVVPSSAGGGTDFYARLLAQALAEALGQQFVVESFPGGSGNIGAAAGARAAPDGYTFLVAADPALTVSQSLFKNLPYDPERDFVPVARGVTVPLVICVQPSLGIRTLGELIERGKRTPRALSPRALSRHGHGVARASRRADRFPAARRRDRRAAPQVRTARRARADPSHGAATGGAGDRRRRLSGLLHAEQLQRDGARRHAAAAHRAHERRDQQGDARCARREARVARVHPAVPLARRIRRRARARPAVLGGFHPTRRNRSRLEIGDCHQLDLVAVLAKPAR